MDLSSPSDISDGTKIGPYVVSGRLGEGGAGEVFAATNPETGDQVALKVLRPGAEVNETIHARFVREISVAQKLSDPHIVEYKDCGVDEGILFYAMEYVTWGSLHDVLQKRGLLPWREVCECGVQICSGLQHLHESSIVHRDLKPANIFLSDDGRLKLGDFGLARDFDSHRLTVDGTAVGTAKYLAPEQARGEAAIDGRTDLYALGCNLFEYLTSRTPFAGDDMQDMATFMEMMRRHVEEAPPKVIDLLPTCPPALSELIDLLLAKDADDRPKTAGIVAKALNQILADPEAPLGEIETGPLERSSESADSSAESDETAEPDDTGEPGRSTATAEPAVTDDAQNDAAQTDESDETGGEPEASLTERLRGPAVASSGPGVSKNKLVILVLIAFVLVLVAAIAVSQQ